MKKENVPQDRSNLESANGRELCYAVDKNGRYTTVNSSGWDPKTIALDNAIKEINARAEDARQRVLGGQTSPIEYYMELHKMDIGILAAYTGFWKWRVKRHFKPKIFKRLPDRILQKYADVFNLNIAQLKNFEIPHGD
ncbi:hypothetical protein LS482_19200 [Sinomicrobium kalidii]|uniref:hypothetical protein n=1 Tax=Sinomicrobium kalidii TaxID=2900738 RepID=UPI001E605340|nr:hypothetical protein [Sinomicrobium kalidii]UGU15795.1 hypothetical protein LS482_19200 [Sinomicrobium kalidii]